LTTGDTEITGIALVLVQPRGAPCSPWLVLCKSLLFRFGAQKPQIKSQGFRALRPSSFDAAASLTNSSLDASHTSFRFVLYAMVPRVGTVVERWPISTSPFGVLRDRTHSMKLAACRSVASFDCSRFASIR